MRVLLDALIASGYLLTLILVVLLVWPLVARLLWAGLGVFVLDAGGVGPFQSRVAIQPLFTISQQVCSLVLLLVAVRQLGRTKIAGSSSH